MPSSRGEKHSVFILLQNLCNVLKVATSTVSLELKLLLFDCYMSVNSFLLS